MTKQKRIYTVISKTVCKMYSYSNNIIDKRKLVAQVAEKSGYAKWEINKIIDPLFDVMLDSLQNGEEIHINNFGKFTLKYH